jgi:hypothetical protein
MARRASEPIEPPDHDDIELPSLGIGHEPVKTRAAILTTADSILVEFRNLPASMPAVLRQLMVLQVRILFVRADADIDPSSFHLAPVSKVTAYAPTAMQNSPKPNQRLSASIRPTLLRHGFSSTAHAQLSCRAHSFAWPSSSWTFAFRLQIPDRQDSTRPL